MRCTQEFGLSENAEKFLEENVDTVCTLIVTKQYADGRNEEVSRTPQLQKEQYDETRGMFDEEIPLYKYILTNGRQVEEFEQASPWSSGPCIFLALRWSDTRESIEDSLWSEDYINSV